MAKEKAKEKANQAKGAEGAQAQHQQSKKTAGVQNKIEQLKKAAILALHEHRGNVSATCASIGIGRTQFYNWKKEDPEFAESVDSVADFCIDIVEQALMKNIDKGSRNLAVLYGYDGRYITAASDPKIQRALMFDGELVKMRIKSDRRALRDRVRDKYGIDIGNVQVELWWVSLIS